jgi:hypothetical protein
LFRHLLPQVVQSLLFKHHATLLRDRTSSLRLFSDAEKIVLTNNLKTNNGPQITIVTVGGTESAALSSQIQEAFTKAGWSISLSAIGTMNIMVMGNAGAQRVDVHGVYLIAVHPEIPAVKQIVSAFEFAGHPVSLNGSSVLRPEGDITLYVALDNSPI